MTETLSVVIERDLPHPPDRVWRALTTPHLIAEWLMPNDFAASPGHAFRLTADWGSVDCRVIAVEPGQSLTYSWAAFELDSTVTFTLTPQGTGTKLRMEQAGFVAGRPQEIGGARYGWTNFLNRLDALLARDAA